MKEHLLITTAIGLMLGTGAFAQSPSDPSKNNPPPAVQSQTNPNSSTPPASSTSSPSSTPSAQNAPSTSSDKSATTTNSSSPNTAGTGSTAPSQAQSAPQPNSPSQAQTNTAPPTNNQTQASPTGNANTNAGTQPSTNTAAQPSNTQSNTAQSSSSNASVSASLNDTQRTRISTSISKLNVAPINNVNFSLSVGTVVPRDVRFQPLPADVVEILPQYRGHSFLVVRDDIVIVDPSTYKIVDVLPRAGRSTAAAPAPVSHKVTFSDRDREVIRKHARSTRIEQRTTGSSTASTRVQIGDRLPESVEVRSFPEEVYRESPRLRDYRFIERENRTYVVEPRERTIIEEIE